MKAITLHQPWASFIAQGLKQYETRSWYTSYRGLLLIHSAKRPIDEVGELLVHTINGKLFVSDTRIAYKKEDYPLGYILAVCDLTNCIRIHDQLINKQSETEKTVGRWEQGRFAWKLEKIIALKKPIFTKGNQGLWNYSLQGGAS